MKAQFFIISSVIIIYIIILTFQYLAGFSDIRLTQIEEQQELSFIPSIKDSFILTFQASNNSSNGDLEKVIRDIYFTEDFFKKEMLKKGIKFDSNFIFFSNGFETSDLSKWTGSYGNPEVVNIEYHGNYSLYCDDIEYVYKNLAGMSEIYVRVYVNFTTLPSNNNIHYFMGFYDNGNQILNLGLWNDQNNYKLRVYSEAVGNYWTSPNIDIHVDRRYFYEDRWQYFDAYYFEMYWYESGTDSKLKVWFEGRLKIDETINSQGNGKSINEYRFGGVDIGGIEIPRLYVDCISIGDRHIGKDCYPDEEPYFIFSLKSKEMKTKTEFGYGG
ncbi:MAG: hypothetical protein GTN40_02395 [Candidatus Aenigmarchaeota archaeon]|nr:hypothetical protein [Candidatus Aenigmarchaeota archaeon]